VSTALAPNTAALTAADRCDRCGAQAYVRATLVSGGELVFCAHHANEFRDALEANGAVFHDETGRLADTPASAPVDER
jgi:hypothetical protein